MTMADKETRQFEAQAYAADEAAAEAEEAQERFGWFYGSEVEISGPETGGETLY